MGIYKMWSAENKSSFFTFCLYKYKMWGFRLRFEPKFYNDRNRPDYYYSDIIYKHYFYIRILFFGMAWYCTIKQKDKHESILDHDV